MPPLLSPLSLRLRENLSALADSKYLLGFSGGVDSVALFFLLLEAQIPFDVAIVHYHTREQADDELAYAQSLAKAHAKRCHIAHAPQFTSSFEAKARAFRFEFFDHLIDSENYAGLILAHQLNDHLEWLLMQLSRGAGLQNLLGFEEVRASKNRTYPILRPLRCTPKAELYGFCQERGLRYFEDSSNDDPRYRRNYFRQRFCDEFISEFAPGVAQSLAYLREDRAALSAFVGLRGLEEQSAAQKGGFKKQGAALEQGQICCVELGGLGRHTQSNALLYAIPLHTAPFDTAPFAQSTATHALDSESSESVSSESSPNPSRSNARPNARHYTPHAAPRHTPHHAPHYAALQACDSLAKRCGYVLSRAQREEIVKSNFNAKIHRLIVARNERAVYVALDLLEMYKIVTISPMDKKFKQLCAQKQVPPKLRKLLWAELCLHIAENPTPPHISESSQNHSQILKIYEDFWQKIGAIFDL